MKKSLNHPLRKAVTLLAVGAASLAAQSQAAELLEWAVLPSESFGPGPTSGQYASGSNGIALPLLDKQPVQGFSAVLSAYHEGNYYAMTDNGFGNKANSPDALLRFHTVKADFANHTVVPASRFTGDEQADFNDESEVTLSDPWHHVPFAIVADGAVYPGTPTNGGTAIAVDASIRTNRLLTGGDFDIESFRRAADDTLWFGDEFGPYLLHTDSKGRLLEAPIPLPNFRKLPSTLGGTEVNPYIQAVSNPQRTLAANLPDSGGFEGMALNQSRTKLYTLMEKAVNGDSVRERLLIHEFNLGARKYTGKSFGYLLDTSSNAIGDFTALTDTKFLVIERDGGQGVSSDSRFTNPARFKKIFKIDLNEVDADGNLEKQEVADLMNIYDPRDVFGDGRTNTVFTFPFQTIESVLPLDNNRLLVLNDNNYPGSAGREYGVPDNNEFIVLHVAPLLSADDCKSKTKDKDSSSKECVPAKE